MNTISEAYASPHNSSPRKFSKWALVGGLLLLLVVLVPLIVTARKVARNRTRSSENLKQLSRALEMYKP